MDFPRWTLGRAGVRLVDLFRRTDSLALHPGVMASQWEDPDRLREVQWEALRLLLEHAAAKVPYYRRLFVERGLKPADFREPGDLARLPRLTKEIIRREGRDMLADDFQAWQPRPKATSGSTGVPLRYWIDRRSHGLHWAFIWRAWSLAGFQPGQRWGLLAGGALAPSDTSFRQRVYQWLNGALNMPAGTLGVAELERYAAQLSDTPLALIWGYPSSLRFLARYIARENLRLRTRHLFTTSELLPASWRREIETATGASLFDVYGNNDGGILAFECERRDGYHINAEGALVEIVDEADHPLPAGDTGEVLATNLHNYAMPFIRYAPGDRAAILAEPCPCGRGLPRLGALGGRVRDCVVTPDGRRVHGSFFNRLLFDASGGDAASWLEAYQVQQSERGALRVLLQARRPPIGTALATLGERISAGLGDDMRIDVELVDEIPRSPAGKYRLIICDLEEEAD